MTLVRGEILREVDGGKWRHEIPCGCAFLFERTADNKAWLRYHVKACGQRFADDGQHRKREVEKVAKLPEVSG